MISNDIPLNENPIAQFQEWFDKALASDSEKYPNACYLSTLGTDGYPEGRIVLLRGVDDRGFVFYTNSQSAKGKAMKKTPKASMAFHWHSLDYQVRVQGDVSPISDDESDEYFSKRARISKIGAWASDQSRVLDHRDTFEARIKEMDAKFPGDDVPRPPHWIGYRISPIRIEFWIDRPYRLHDRFLYQRSDTGWTVDRLYP